MSGVDLDHPEVIFIKRLNGTGYGFFYSTPAQFDNANMGFMRPILTRIDQEAEEKGETPSNVHDFCYQAAVGSIRKIFAPDWTEDPAAIDAARCVAASCAAYKDWNDVPPQCVVIEEIGDDVTIREGSEFLDHPGYPCVIVIGSKADGGGPATYFDSFEEFKQIASKPPRPTVWLPQLIYRLYVKTPSIMTGIPTAPDDAAQGVGVQCHAYTLNRKGKLVERPKRSS